MIRHRALLCICGALGLTGASCAGLGGSRPPAADPPRQGTSGRLEPLPPLPSIEELEAATALRPPGRTAPSAADPVGKGDLLWPVEGGALLVRYGTDDGRRHAGIDIAGPTGTPVRAAAAGTVIYSGVRDNGYGNLVVIEHPGGLQTAYAHNRENVAAAGARVQRGDVIAHLGQTGRAAQPALHFEVRERGVPQNPLYYIDGAQ